MNSSDLQTFLTERLLKARSGKPKLRLGILATGIEQRQLAPLWEDLPETLFEPKIYLMHEDRETASSVLTDERQFHIVEGLRSREEVISKLLADVEASALDLILVVQSAGHNLVHELLDAGGSALSGEAPAGFALHHPKQLERPLLIGDLLIHSEPTPEQLAAVSRLGAIALGRLGVERPRVALLAAVETVSEGLPATVLGSATAELLADDPDLCAQGPLSMDLAISQHAAEKKGVTGDVVGKADILAAPNMTVARGVYEALCGLCEEPSAVVMAGGKLPIAIPGGCDGREGVILSTFFASLL